MRCRPVATFKSLRGKAAVLVALVALGCLSTGCFETGQDTRSQARVDADLSNLSRPFSYGKVNGTATARVEVVAAEDLSALPAAGTRFGSASLYDPEDPQAAFSFSREFAGAREYRFDGTAPDIRSVQVHGDSRPRETATPAQSLMASATVYLDRSFNSLFASLFKRVSEETGPTVASQGNSREETANPFTEARQKAEASAASVARAASASSTEATPAKTTEASESPAATQPVTTPGGGTPAVPRVPPYVFLGDFDASGKLQAAEADRLDDVTFSFTDTLRVLSLYVNPAAVENQRSFGVEDLDGDGIADLLVTARASLSGGVLLGGADGTFTLRDTFVTGYEPMVAVSGAMREGRRDILTVNMRSGKVATFRASPRYRQVQSPSPLGFLPDFANHIVELQTGRDFLMAAEAGRGAQIFGWNEDSKLEATGARLPMTPTLALSEELLQDTAVETVQAYQLGSYASITLTDSHGRSFNVANIRITPQLFIAVGDFSRKGTLDVAVASLRGTQAR